MRKKKHQTTKKQSNEDENISLSFNIGISYLSCFSLPALEDTFLMLNTVTHFVLPIKYICMGCCWWISKRMFLRRLWDEDEKWKTVIFYWSLKLIFMLIIFFCVFLVRFQCLFCYHLVFSAFQLFKIKYEGFCTKLLVLKSESFSKSFLALKTKLKAFKWAFLN